MPSSPDTAFYLIVGLESTQWTMEYILSVKFDQMDRIVCSKESGVIVLPEAGEDDKSPNVEDDRDAEENCRYTSH